MIKVKIVLDEEKILREKKYDIEKMWDAIDGAFLSKNIMIEEKGWYYGTNHPHDYSNFGLVCLALEKEFWFMDNVIEWKYYINDTPDNDDFTEEDFLAQAKVHKAGSY